MQPLSWPKTVYEYFGLGLFTIVSFVICSWSRLALGDQVAKRIHEYVVGYGLYWWMRLPGFWRVKIVGALPKDAARHQYVVISNHCSWADSALLSFVPLYKKYLTKSRYFRLPFFGWTQWIVGDIGVDVSSKEGRAQSVEACKQSLAKGNSIVIYPEGTRTSQPPRMQEFKAGAFRIARDAKVPILPVALKDSHLSFGQFENWWKPVTMEIHIGEPFLIENDDIDAAIKKARRFIASKVPGNEEDL